MYRVVVSLGVGSLETGFESVSVSLIDPNGNQQLKRIGKLPPNPLLKRLSQEWKQSYRAYYISQDQLSSRLEFVADEENPYHFSESDFRICCDRLQATLDEWLNFPDFSQITILLRSRLSHQNSFQWIIESVDPVIQHLPWHLWHFFQDYPLAEVAISLPEFEKIVPIEPTPWENLKILVILGKTVNDLGDEINVQADRRIIEAIPNVSAVFVTKTSRTELGDLLWEQNWDVILFAGHSSAPSAQGNAGFLLDSDEPQNLITIQELESAFKKAIQCGLKLVIFNSCDSFGLGLDLMRLNLPQCIAMGEAIPDAVAQRFLRYLIQQWYEDKSFVVAVRHARARLKESEEMRFPCASWLPVVCQNPAALPPRWPVVTPEISSSPTVKTVPQTRKPQARRVLRTILTGLSLSLCLLGVRFLGGMQRWELQGLDSLMRLAQVMHPEQTDETIFLITISEADIQYQDQQNMPRRGSLSDVALRKVLEKLKPLNPKAIGVDIFHDFPYEDELAKVIKALPNFIAVCEVGFSDDQSVSIAPPPSTPIEVQGFTDLVRDADDRIRRQLLRMAPSEVCPTDYGLGLKLAEVYLDKTVKLDPQGLLSIGALKLPRLTVNSGGYSLPATEASGYQIMTRFRHTHFHIPRFNQMSLQEVLTGSNQSQFQEWAKGTVVMIGLKQRNRDALYTPLRLETQGKMMGLEVHAHMASQIIQGVEQERPLLWWWSEQNEMLWIGLWIMSGVMVTHFWRSSLYSIGILGGMAAIATVICYGVFLTGGWIPWVPVLLGLEVLTIGYGVRLGLNRKRIHPSLDSSKQ